MDWSKKLGFAIHIVTRESGVKELYAKFNVITSVGLQRMASHHASANPNKELFTHIAFGTGITLAEDDSNIALETELHRKAFDNIFAAGTILYGDVTILASEIGGDSYDISEIALYDASTGGNMIARQLLYDEDEDDDGTISNFTGADRIDTLWGITNQ